MKLYRIMRIDADGKPMEGVRRSMLGVRPTDPANADPTREYDVEAVVNTDLVPAGRKQGLSVFADRSEIEGYVKKKDRMWEIEADELVHYSLVAVPDPVEGGKSHHVLEPIRDTTLGEYQEDLKRTRDLWDQMP